MTDLHPQEGSDGKHVMVTMTEQELKRRELDARIDELNMTKEVVKANQGVRGVNGSLHNRIAILQQERDNIVV